MPISIFHQMQYLNKMSNKDAMIEEGEIEGEEPQKMQEQNPRKLSHPGNSSQQGQQTHPHQPGKKVDIVTMLKSNPTRLKYLKESLKFFTPIKKNIYLDRKRKSPKNDEMQSCLCRPRGQGSKSPEYTNVSYNCQERCLNRMISTECDDETCKCGDFCQNRKFQRHQYACVYPFPAGGKGWGLKAGQFIQRGEFIMQYIGQIFSITSEVGKLRVKQYSSSTCTYLMKTSSREVIDPTYKGNLARFINHSCQPNCITRKWNVLGQICIGIFATRDIQEDDELTFDYHFDVYSTPLTKCLCGAKKCKGYLGLRPTDLTAGEWNDRLEDMICLICNNTYDDDDVKLIICDQCNEGFHVYCLDPPLQQIPEDSFFCKECLTKKQVQKQRVEKERKQMLRLKKLEEMNNAKKREEKEESSDEDIVPSNQQYQRMYRFIKKVEQKAAKQLIEEQLQQKENKNGTPHKKASKPNAVINRRKDELYELNRKAIDKFQIYLQKNQDLLQRINNFGHKKQRQNQNEKKSFLLNTIQIHLLLKSNYTLFQKIGAQIYLDNHHKNTTDYFLKSTEMSITGNMQQINIFQEIVNVTNQIINELQIEMGITQAYIPIPALYIKRLIGPGHSGINQIQKMNQVAVHYHRRFANEQCYPLQANCKLLIKGGKDNILRAYQDIKKRISNLEIQRLYLNPYEIKTIVNNMISLKKKPGMAEFRICRQVPFKQVNHPFYYIQQKNKQITIIGTRQEIEKTRKQILSFFEQPNRKQQYNYNISLFLAQPNHKSPLLSVKSSLEKQIPSIKMMIFDPTPPRKNMTLSFLGTRQNRQKAKQFLFKRLQQYSRQGKMSINLQHFQDQMNYQMTKYYFKYMQNAMLTKDTAFMKSWDILNCYYYDSEPNYMWKSIKKQLLSDYETLLYACFVLKDKIIRKIQNQTDSNNTLLEEVFVIVRQNMNRVLNIYNVNNASGLKNYSSVIDYEEAKKTFKDFYSHVQFIKREQTRMVNQKEEVVEVTKPKEREWSFFERKVFKKYKNLLTLLQDEISRNSRERQEQRKRDKWR